METKPLGPSAPAAASAGLSLVPRLWSGRVRQTNAKLLEMRCNVSFHPCSQSHPTITGRAGTARQLSWCKVLLSPRLGKRPCPLPRSRGPLRADFDNQTPRDLALPPYPLFPSVLDYFEVNFRHHFPFKIFLRSSLKDKFYFLKHDFDINRDFLIASDGDSALNVPDPLIACF